MHLSETDYRTICEWVYAYSCVQLGANKQSFVDARLSSHIQQKGFRSYRAYIDYLKKDKEEVEVFLDRLTTHHTFFFREFEHFQFLAEQVLPRFETGRHCSIWSAACSTGEEAYSLAILLSEDLGDNGNWSVYGSDLSRASIEKAREGIFRKDRLKELATSLRRKYLLEGIDDSKGLFKVQDSLQKKVTFERRHLLDGFGLQKKQFSVIFCCNVMIYFDKLTQQQLVERLFESLAPGGYLIVGHSENLSALVHPLECVTSSIYRKDLCKMP
ncbi:MAG: hypothetical protein A2Y14_01210 [Verrucomicrobia bacterium GWF2_51_19]|nr:MAG: hypothetical protein A2Y14_01210 [Verrucomicrobia bacterium GWF2_51_19]HCJ12202.1 SAM-dependent methyltransferase [Opitutae bacterium]